MLRDRLACGLRNEHIQKKLLFEADFTCTPALDIAVAMETAAGDATELQSKLSLRQVYINCILRRELLVIVERQGNSF